MIKNDPDDASTENFAFELIILNNIAGVSIIIMFIGYFLLSHENYRSLNIGGV